MTSVAAMHAAGGRNKINKTNLVANKLLGEFREVFAGPQGKRKKK